MKNIKLIAVAAVILIAGSVYLVSWFTSTVPLKITISPDSQISTNLVVTTSKDGHRKIHKLPYKTRVKPGDYTIAAWGNGSSTVTENVSATKGGENTLELLFSPTSGESFLDLYQKNDQAKTIPFEQLFPKETVDYLITAKDNGEVLTEITIAAKHRFTKPSDPSGYKEERDIVVAAAKKWLSDQGVPSSIEIKIIDI